MKIIILAAGKGERLLPLTRNTPKPLLDMGNGNTLLEEQLERMDASGVIDEIVLVIGYRADQIEAKLALYVENAVNIRTVFNPFYDLSNNLISLWMARHEMSTDFLVSNGDCLFSPAVYAGLVSVGGNGIFLCSADKNHYDDDDMKIRLEGGQIAEVSKLIPPKDADAESPGLALVRGAKHRRLFVETLEGLARERSYLNRFWLEVFNRMSERGVAIRPWSLTGIGQWQEVDFHLDVRSVKELLAGGKVHQTA